MIRAFIIADGERELHGSERLLGLGVTERIYRNLRSHGLEWVTLLGASEGFLSQYGDSIRRFPVPKNAITTLAERVACATEGAVVIPANTICHPKLMQALIDRGIARGRTQIAMTDSAHAVVFIHPRDIRQLPDVDTVDQLAEQFIYKGIAERFVLPPRYFVMGAEDIRSRKAAENALQALNWRAHDGLVARHVNKHISTRISAWIADTPITPNGMTLFAFLVALMGVGLTAMGTYLTFMLGAALMQTQSILDGCDGELSRMRYQSSRFGAWLDTIVDDVLGVLWLAAMGIGLFHRTGNAHFLLLGGIAAGLHAVSSGVIYAALMKSGGVGHQDFIWWFEENDTHGEESAVNSPLTLRRFMKYSIRRDFYVLFFLGLAVLDMMWAALYIGAAGACALATVTLIQVSKRGLTAAPQS